MSNTSLTKENALALRKRMSKKRPAFVRTDFGQRKEVSSPWRKPRGLQSKSRHGVFGKPVKVNIGFRGPVLVRGVHVSGLQPVRVENVAALASVDKNQGIIISGRVGLRVRMAIMKAAQLKKIMILNWKDPAGFIIKAEKRLQERIVVKSVREKQVQQKAAVPAPQLAEKVTSVEKSEKSAEQEKKELDKLLTKME